MSTQNIRFRATSTKAHPPDKARQEEIERQVQETARRQGSQKRERSGEGAVERRKNGSED